MIQVSTTPLRALRAHLHQASASTLRQFCDDTRDSVLFENNEIAPEWGCNPFLSDSIVFNKNRIASIITELLQSCHGIDADALCKRALSLLTTQTATTD